jgi:hypothetical protein
VFRAMRDQYGETNVMHFLSSLLRNKGLYLFRAFLAHPQESLHKTAVGILRACYVRIRIEVELVTSLPLQSV